MLLVGKRKSMHVLRWSRFLDGLGIGYDLFSMIPGEEYEYGFGKDLSPRLSISYPTADKALNPLRSAVGSFIAARYELVNVHSLDLWQTPIALASRRRLVVSCLGSDILVLYRRARGLLRAAMRRALRRADAITCDAEPVRKALADDGIDETKIRLLSWGVNQRQFRPLPGPERAAIRRSFGLPADATVLLSNRTVSPIYRIREIIELFKERVRRKDIVLFVHVNPFGDPSYAEECFSAARGAANIVFNPSPLPPERLHELYNAADACLHFPRSDALPVSMLEALACGNVVICDSGIDAYEDVAKRYSVTRISLRDLDEETILGALSDGGAAAGRNIEELSRSDSDESSRIAIGGLFAELGVPAHGSGLAPPITRVWKEGEPWKPQ